MKEDALVVFRGGRAVQTIVAALLAWGITVAPAGFSRGAAPMARPFAVLALLAAVAGPLYAARAAPVQAPGAINARRALPRRRIGRHVGISIFLLLAVAVWWMSPGALHPARIEPVRALAGSLAWGAFALSWREAWPTPPPLARDGELGPLPGRATLPLLSIPILVVALLASGVLMATAFRVREVERGLFAQALAAGLGVALVTSAATLAISRGKERPLPPTRRVGRHAVRALGLLAVVAIAGAVVILLR